MGMNGYFAVGQLAASGAIDYDIAQPVLGTDGTRHTPLSTNGYMIAADTEHPEAAQALVAALVDPAFLADAWGTPGHSVPARLSAADSVIDPSRAPANQQAIVDAMGYGQVFQPSTSAAFEAYGATADLFTKANTGELPVEEAMARSRPRPTTRWRAIASRRTAGSCARRPVVTIRGATRPRLGPLRRRRERWFHLLIAPWLIGFLLFQAGPIVAVFLLSFGEWPIPQAPRWVGLDNLQELARDPLFWRTFGNTTVYAIGTVVPGLAIGLGLALLVRRPRRGIGTFRLIFFLPVLVSGVATALMWGWLLNPRYGLAEQVLRIGGCGWSSLVPRPNMGHAGAHPDGPMDAGVTMLVYVAALNAVPGSCTTRRHRRGGPWGRSATSLGRSSRR